MEAAGLLPKRISTASRKILATLAKQGMFKSAYNVWTPDGQWAIHREGFWRTEFVVHDSQGDEIARGTYHGMSGKADLRTIAGYEYQWRSTNFWGTRWEWRALDDTPLVSFDNKRILILTAAQALPDLALLVVLAQYLKIYRDDDSDSVVIAASAAT